MIALNRVGIIGRFKPLHNGHAHVLDAIGAIAKHTIVGIGSANRYNANNPFTADETKAMIAAYASSSPQRGIAMYAIDDVGIGEDLEAGKAWAQQVKAQFGHLDAFVTGNPWVHTLLQDHYRILSPAAVAGAALYPINATTVRTLIANDQPWQIHVPAAVAQYLAEHNLDARVRREFGATLRAQR